jgi:hypothetical protein
VGERAGQGADADDDAGQVAGDRRERVGFGVVDVDRQERVPGKRPDVLPRQAAVEHVEHLSRRHDGNADHIHLGGHAVNRNLEW